VKTGAEPPVVVLVRAPVVVRLHRSYRGADSAAPQRGRAAV
jgi:hypothetical protein